MSLINWLIHFLGGFTKEEYALLGGSTKKEYALLTKEYENQRDSRIQNRARVEFLEAELKIEREDRKYIQDIFYKKLGIIASEEIIHEDQENLQPISNGPQRWSNLKARLEKDDNERLKANGQN